MNPDVTGSSQVQYLDDFVPGQRYVTGTYLVDEAEIKAFATHYDPQPFHLDGEAARSTFFEGLSASGWHTAAITMRLLVTSTLRPAGGYIGAGAEVSWPRPTRPGDILRVESEVVEVKPSRSRPDRGVVTFLCTTLNQRNEPVQSTRASLVVFRRPPV